LLEEFRHSGLHLDGVEVTFPDMFELDFSHGEDEDGWIQVHKQVPLPGIRRTRRCRKD
jgi:hypothetical protein